MYNIQDQVHLDQMVFVIVRWGGWTARVVAKSNYMCAIRLEPLKSDGSFDGQTGILDWLTSS